MFGRIFGRSSSAPPATPVYNWNTNQLVDRLFKEIRDGETYDRYTPEARDYITRVYLTVYTERSQNLPQKIEEARVQRAKWEKEFTVIPASAPSAILPNPPSTT